MNSENNAAEKIDITAALATAKGLLGKGQISGAIDRVQGVLELVPDNDEGLYILAVCYRYAKQPRPALESLEKLLEIYPNYARAYQERGHVHLQLNQPDEAVKAYEKAISLNAALISCWTHLIDLYKSSGKARLSENARQQALALSQLPKELLSATSFFHEGKLYKAEMLCRKFMQNNPRHLEGMRLLANIGLQLYVLDDAEFLLESCLEFEPNFYAARYDYLKVLHKRQKFEKALEQAKILLAVDPDNSIFQTAYANECLALGDFDKSLEVYDKLIAEMPNNESIHMSRGHVLKTVGRQEEAIKSYHNAGRIKPDLGDVFWSLANLKTYRFEDEELIQMKSNEAATTTSLADRYHLCFALGKAFEDREDFVTSFEYYERGNALKKAELRFDINRVLSDFQSQKDVCTPSLFSEKSNQGCLAQDPIFIVGLPRAGSTLLEQILASHPLVDGTQELPNILGLAYKLKGRHMVNKAARYPGILADLSAEQLRKHGQEYIDTTKIHRKGAPYFTDKMPNNFAHIGLINLILPNAKIIDARRHPMACCFSGFKQLFAEGQEFSYDLKDIGQYYQGYVELMDHWDSVLPGKILRVQYEDVVADLETEVRRVLDFCGLPFDKKCVAFHKTERAVRTASSEQVRQPLYNSGIEQWKSFEPYLNVLKETLSGLSH